MLFKDRENTKLTRVESEDYGKVSGGLFNDKGTLCLSNPGEVMYLYDIKKSQAEGNQKKLKALEKWKDEALDNLSNDIVIPIAKGDYYYFGGPGSPYKDAYDQIFHK